MPPCFNAGMTLPGLFLSNESEFEAAALQTVIAIGDGLTGAVCIARVLVEHGRVVDLAGLDRGVGLLVAKALDLPHEQGRSLRPHLIALRDEIERLTAALHHAEKK